MQLYNFIGILSLELLKWITFKNEKSRSRRECICFRIGIKKNGMIRWGLNWRLVKGMLIGREACQSLNSKRWQWTNWSGFMIWLSQATVSKKEALCVFLCVCVSGVGEINDLVFSGLLKGISIRQMEKWAVGILGIHIYIVLYSSVIIQINCLGQMVGLSSHAVCLFVCKWNVYMSRELWEESKRKQPIQPKRR